MKGFEIVALKAERIDLKLGLPALKAGVDDRLSYTHRVNS